MKDPSWWLQYLNFLQLQQNNVVAQAIPPYVIIVVIQWSYNDMPLNQYFLLNKLLMTSILGHVLLKR